MTVHGYVSHASKSRRFAGMLFVLYLLAFELVGTAALTLLLLILDPAHTILTDPWAYTLRYALPLALMSGLMFVALYRSHAKAVTRALDIRIVTRAEELRFVTIAEQACTTLGVRFPRFGIIEAPGLNALTVGAGPSAGLMVTTRGLLNRLDDDELAAVFAHEASHIRQGDTRILAINHALMRTAVLWQLNNPLRIEQWQQLLLLVLIPPMLILLLAGGLVTMISLELARFARRGIKLSRDHVADGEAVRATHFPEALMSALRKVSGRSAFPGSRRFEGLLFDGPADREGGTHPAIDERLKWIAKLGGELMDGARQRRDTRSGVRPAFGVTARQPSRATLYPTDGEGRPLQQPPTPTLRLLALRLTDPDAYRQWREATISWWEWRASDRRNLLGITYKMAIPVAVACVFSLVFWWPRDNDAVKFADTFSPAAFVRVVQMTNSGPDCFGPSYPDGICPGYDYSPEQLAAKRQQAEVRASQPKTDGPPDSGFTFLMSLLIVSTLLVGIFKPALLKRLAGVVDATPEQLGELSVKPRAPLPSSNETTAPPGNTPGFGRKVV
jgi:Zn-dependent protease with chaperone function